MFTDYEPEPMDDNEIDREDLEECVLEQMLKDIGSGLVGEVLHSLSNLSQDALLMPPYVVPSIDPKVFTQFLWSSN